MGGLNITSPETILKGFQQNLIQRIVQKTAEGTPSLLPELLNNLLESINRPSLDQHLSNLGPAHWKQTGNRLMAKNEMLGKAFQAMSELLETHESSTESWHCAAIRGHTLMGKHLLKLTAEEEQLLQDHGLHTVSQLLEENDAGGLTRAANRELINRLARDRPWIRPKLTALVGKITALQLPIADKRTLDVTTGALLVRAEKHLSQVHSSIIRKQLTKKICTAPAYRTRARDGIYRPNEDTFRAGYKMLEAPMLPSKTKEVAFEILNRTIWTNNKAFKSGLTETPDCERCGEVETMEHLLHDCAAYSTPLWEEFGAALTAAVQAQKNGEIARIRMTPREIIFNAPHPSILLHVPDDAVRKAILLLTQEVKRNIIHKRMNNAGGRNTPTTRTRIIAHLIAVASKVYSYLEYVGTKDAKAALSMINSFTLAARENIN